MREIESGAKEKSHLTLGSRWRHMDTVTVPLLEAKKWVGAYVG